MRILITALFTIGLIGCASSQETKVAHTVETKLIQIPIELLHTCEVTPPPNKKDYLKTDLEGREELLVKYAQHLLLDLRNCDDKIAAIKQWQTNVGKIYEQQNQRD